MRMVENMKVKSLILKEEEFEDEYGHDIDNITSSFKDRPVLESGGSVITTKTIGEVHRSQYIEGEGIEIVCEISDSECPPLDQYELCPTVLSKNNKIQAIKNVFFSVGSDDMVGETVKYTPSVLDNGLYE